MDWSSAPAYIGAAVGAAITALGLVIAGLIKARSDGSLGFTAAVVARVNAVEQHANEREELCEKRLEAMAAMFGEQIKRLEDHISRLEAQTRQLERRRVPREDSPNTRL